MMRASEAQACMKEIQVALDTAMIDKQNAETEATMVKEKAESYKHEIKRLELMVSTRKMFLLCDVTTVYQHLVHCCVTSTMTLIISVDSRHCRPSWCKCLMLFSNLNSS